MGIVFYAAKTILALLLLIVSSFVGLKLLATDVYVDVPGADAFEDSSFCGSAYDVALIKRDGYMGGEYSPNQSAKDAACIAESKRDVYRAISPGVIVLFSLAYAVHSYYRGHSEARRRREARFRAAASEEPLDSKPVP